MSKKTPSITVQNAVSAWLHFEPKGDFHYTDIAEQCMLPQDKATVYEIGIELDQYDIDRWRNSKGRGVRILHGDYPMRRVSGEASPSEPQKAGAFEKINSARLIAEMRAEFQAQINSINSRIDEIQEIDRSSIEGNPKGTEAQADPYAKYILQQIGLHRSTLAGDRTAYDVASVIGVQFDRVSVLEAQLKRLWPKYHKKDGVLHFTF